MAVAAIHSAHVLTDLCFRELDKGLQQGLIIAAPALRKYCDPSEYCWHANVCLAAGWVPPSLSTVSPPAAATAAESLLPASTTAAAAMQPRASQDAGQPLTTSSVGPPTDFQKSESNQAFFGLHSYASDSESESDSASSDGSMAPAKGQSLGPFF